MLVDTHAHLNHEDFRDDVEDALSRALRAGVGLVVVPGFDRASSECAVELAGKPGVAAAVGFHPHDAKKLGAEDLAWMAAQFERGAAVAVGEIGLDYYRDLSPRAVQQDVFRAQMSIAKHFGLPVIVHNRAAGADVLRILKEESSEAGGVMHCFSEDAKYAEQAIELGFHIGIAGPITYRSSVDLREVAKMMPLDRLVVETDSPYIAPQPFRGRRNEPAYVSAVAETIAQLRGISFEEVAAATTRNALRLFRLHSPVPEDWDER